MSYFDHTVEAKDGSEVSLTQYAGKVLLIVNTATGCGFTPQYEDLERIYAAHRDQGFEILDFPCNQFANQAPDDNEEIHKFCTGRFGVTFPQLGKVDVNGENADPLWKYLTSTTKFEGFDGPSKLMLSPIVKKMDKDYPRTERDIEQIGLARSILSLRGTNTCSYPGITCPICGGNVIAGFSYDIKDSDSNTIQKRFHMPSDDKALVFHTGYNVWIDEIDTDEPPAYLCLTCGNRFGTLEVPELNE